MNLKKGNTESLRRRHQKLAEKLGNDTKTKSKRCFKLKSSSFSGSFKLGIFTFLLFLLGSLLPNLSAYYTVSDGEGLIIETDASFENFSTVEATDISDDGFVTKSAPQTAKGDRDGMSEVVEYTVEKGDTLSEIANKFSIDVNTIVWANNISNSNSLKVGQTLKILPVSGVLYKVGSNETISKIAKKYNIEIASMLKQNGLDEEADIQKGQNIIIPGGKKIYAQPVAQPKRYVASYTTSSTYSYGGTIVNNDSNKVVKPVVASSKKLLRPCAGIITQGYKRGHRAIDIAKRGGGPIRAAQAGTVIKATGGWNGGYGNYVIIDHGNGMKTLYAHLKVIHVKKGQNVSRGQIIGMMGNTGRVYGVTGIHLHFEVINNGVKKNPYTFF